ncbi:MAG: NAD-dependent dehydratase, partial [Spirochaetota bacterium]
KRYSVVLDNAKIKRYVPGYRAEISFAEGMRRSAGFYDLHPDAKQTNEKTDAFIDRLVEAIRGVKP